MNKILLLILILLISGCLDSTKSTLENTSTDVIQYTKNVSIPDPCVRIEGNTSCISDINISVKIDK